MESLHTSGKTHITPIPMFGNAANIANYRLISIKCVLAKIFDNIIFNKLYPHFANFILPEQGAVKKRSVLINLMSFNIDIIRASSNSSYILEIYTDMSNAFDKYNRNILLSN